MKTIISNELTIVTACKNRQNNLRRAIPGWLSLDPRKIIICDWGSSTPLAHDNLGINPDKRVDIIRSDADRWVLSWAFNEALIKVDTAYTLKLDCDHLVSADFLERNPSCFGHFARGHIRHAETGQQYINGAFMSCTDLLRRVGYYDERITTYGWEDSDLYSRLYDACLGSSIFTKGSIAHLDQCESTRTKEQQVSKESALAEYLGIRNTEFLITRNRVLCGMLWPWDSNAFKSRKEIRNRFAAPEPEEEALIEYATLKAFQLHYGWKNLYSKNGTPASEAYAEVLYAFDQCRSNMPVTLGLSALLRRYSEASRRGDKSEKNLMRLAILSNTREIRLRARLKALDRLDAFHMDRCPESGKKKPMKPIVLVVQTYISKSQSFLLMHNTV